MPFSSQKQRAFMYARHPKIAKRWRKESGPQRGLPEYSRGGKAQTDERERGADLKHDERDQMLKKFLAKHRK